MERKNQEKKERIVGYGKHVEQTKLLYFRLGFPMGIWVGNMFLMDNLSDFEYVIDECC